MQVGAQAYGQIFDLTLDGVDFPSGAGLMIVDMNVGVGHGFEAFVSKVSSLNVPAFYYAGAADATTAEWFLVTKREWLAKEFRAGHVKVPGHRVPPAEMPGELVLAEPGPPRLNVLKERRDLYPEVPDHVIQAICCEVVICVGA